MSWVRPGMPAAKGRRLALTSVKVWPPLLLLGALLLPGTLGTQGLLAQQPAPAQKVEPKAAKPAAPKQDDTAAKARQKKAEPPAKAAGEPASTTPRMPGPVQLAILVQTFMVALSQANLTNNFTVLYALSAPDFQKENPPEKMSSLFSGFRTRNIDLTPIVIFSPILVRPPEIDANGMLRLTGYYKTAPQQVRFDLLLQAHEGSWRLFGISVETKTAPPAEPAKK